MTKHQDYVHAVVLGVIGGICLSVSFLLGFLVRDLTETSIANLNNSDPTDEGYPLLVEVQYLLDNVYLREQPSYPDRQYAAIRGVLEILGDPTTLFIEPPVAQSESQALAGTYGGIGVQVKLLEDGQYAIYPFVDNPAYLAGIRDNDILLAVNDTPVTSSIPIDTLDQMLRGEVAGDNGVTVTVIRGEETISKFIKFDVINVPSVIARTLMENEGIGYVQILRFTSRTPEELHTALEGLKSENIAALIIDLRDNGGGLLVESIEVADEFLDSGVVVYERSRDKEQSYPSTNGGLITDLPIAILVNDHTASASELVAGALRDNGRAILVGQKTFGKGTVQQIYPLSDGSSVHITSAEWLTPNRAIISNNGLEPDIAMIPDENQRDIELGEAIRQLQQIIER